MNLDAKIHLLATKTNHSVAEIQTLMEQKTDALSGLIDQKGAFLIVAKNLGYDSQDFTTIKVNNMNLQQWLDEADPSLIKEFPNLTILWIAQSPKGPYTGKNGDFYTLSMKLDDGSVTDEWVDDQGQTREGHGVFVSFSYKEWMDNLQKGDHVSAKLRYSTYTAKNGEERIGIKGSYLHQAKGITNQGPTPTTPAPTTDTKLIAEVIDPLFNAMWDVLTDAQQRDILEKYTEQIHRLNEVLPE
jgi:hypothetical protein